MRFKQIIKFDTISKVIQDQINRKRRSLNNSSTLLCTDTFNNIIIQADKKKYEKLVFSFVKNKLV